MKLASKIALITGAGRGIGRAVALAYAREGAKVAICARTAAELEETAGAIRAQGGDCRAWVCDVSSESSVADLFAKVENDCGKIDVLINNAGVMTRPAPLAEVEVKKWDYTIAVNLRGTFLVTRAILPLMMRQKSGSVINVSSMIGRGAYANFTAYAASKWGIEGLTQTLAAEVRPYNIRVNSVDPGYVATKLTGYRGGKPESVTEVFVFLGSDESRSVSGKALSSSGWRAEVGRR
jgi:3-oxoacyl-[acyl-carrier protein] reductase